MTENLYLTLFKSSLPRNFSFNLYKVYFIKKFELSAEYLKLFELNFNKDNFSTVLNDMKYNPEGHNLIVFYLEYTKKAGEIYLVSNSMEINRKEFILKKFSHAFDEKILKMPTVEKIN